MSIRRKQRQRGKLKELRRKALKTWDRLTQTDEPEKSPETVHFSGVLLPRIRKVMPSVIARDLVGVQPLSAPAGMFGDNSSGIEPTFVCRRGYNYGQSKKEISEQRKAERKIKKREKSASRRESNGMEKAEYSEFKVTSHSVE